MYIRAVQFLVHMIDYRRRRAARVIVPKLCIGRGQRVNYLLDYLIFLILVIIIFSFFRECLPVSTTRVKCSVCIIQFYITDYKLPRTIMGT
jgi:hypothetical protein